MKLFLIEWMRENHLAVLEEWMDLEDLLVDLDVWLEELYGAIDQEYQAYMEGEEECLAELHIGNSQPRQPHF